MPALRVPVRVHFVAQQRALQAGAHYPHSVVELVSRQDAPRLQPLLAGQHIRIIAGTPVELEIFAVPVPVLAAFVAHLLAVLAIPPLHAEVPRVFAQAQEQLVRHPLVLAAQVVVLLALLVLPLMPAMFAEVLLLHALLQIHAVAILA